MLSSSRILALIQHMMTGGGEGWGVRVETTILCEKVDKPWEIRTIPLPVTYLCLNFEDWMLKETALYIIIQFDKLTFD